VPLSYDDYAASLRTLQRNRYQLRMLLEHLRAHYPAPGDLDAMERFIGSVQNLIDGHTHLLKRLALLWQDAAGGVSLGPGGEPTHQKGRTG
jgi:hypothetical protein